MTQAELNREIARATKESVATIAHMGFVPLTPFPLEREREQPLFVDWDELDKSREMIHPLGR